MKSSKIWIIILSLFLVVGLLPSNPCAQAKTIELRLAHMFPVTAPAGKYIESWAEKIAKDSNGQLKIRIFPSNTLIIAPEMFDGVVKGAADIGYAFRYKPNNYTIGVLFPFILSAPDTVTATKVYDDIWNKFPQLMAEEWQGVRLLWASGAMAQYLFTRKPTHSLADFKGQQIRVPSRELGEVIKALGATPVFMSTADFVIGIEKGTVDGCIMMPAAISDNKIGDKLKYGVMGNFGLPTPVSVFMNEESFNKLPMELQIVVEGSTASGKANEIKCWSDLADDSMKYLKSAGIEFLQLSPEEQTQLNNINEGVRNKIGQDLDEKGLPGTELIQFIRDRVRLYANQ